MRPLHHIVGLRRILLPVLQRLSPGDIHLCHHWTGERFVLDAFKHKSYWYHGKRREQATMLLFADLIERGDRVIEIGGHIGYLSLYLAQLTGPAGRVTVFEPGPNNLPYLRRNVAAKPWVEVLEQAVTDRVGSARFHLENITGQNNSLLEDCRARQFNEATAFAGSTDTSTVDVTCTTLDDFVKENGCTQPSFIKIDVEGAELQVLQGMKCLLEAGPALMVEVTEHGALVMALLRAASYELFSDRRQRIGSARDMRGNVFCLKSGDRRLVHFET